MILGLIIFNGFFAASEIAIISMRRSKTAELTRKGLKSAKIIGHFQSHPENFLATIQVGITLVSTIASAYGGASLTHKIAPYFENFPIAVISNNPEVTAFILVVLLISYFSLIFGELVPKSLALRYSNKIALAVSYPLRFFSIIFYLFVKFLTFSTNLMLATIKDKASFTEAKLSEEEIRFLIKESEKAGTIEKREHEFIENIFEFGDLDVQKVMIPHNKMYLLDITEPPGRVLKKMIAKTHSRIPFYEKSEENIIGILYIKDLISKLVKKQKIDIRDLLRPPLYMPETESLHDVLQEFKKTKTHMAIVLDEHGGVSGLVTLEDILEEIVGEINDEADVDTDEIIALADGSYLVDGSSLVTDINHQLITDIPEDEAYNSVSGFILHTIRKFPKKGAVITYKNLEIKIKEVTKKRIKSVIIKKTD